jgi:hypothetical protein
MQHKAALIDKTSPSALKRTHKRSKPYHPTAYTVKQGGITYGTLPERGSQRVHIRATPEKIKQIQANIATTIQEEKQTAAPKRQWDKQPDLSEDQRKWKRVHHGLMAPSGRALTHPEAKMLLEFSIKGCPVKTGHKWTQQMLEVALEKGAHPSARDPVAASQLWEESLDKAKQGFCCLVPWESNKADPPKNLKISPIAAIPHKSRNFRMILDMLYGVSINGTRMPSVNEATDSTIPPSSSMAELGNV